MIDLRRGHPPTAELPHAALAKACAAAAADLTSNAEAGLAIQYGAPRGCASHLDTLQRWLERRYGSKVRRDGLFTTNGASHGLELCAAALTKPGDEVVMEAPTYFLAAQVFRDHGLSIRAAPVDAGGLDVDALERALRAGTTRPKALYVVPRHGNPSGASLDAQRRAKLAALAREFGFYVLADDVYHLLDWSSAPLRRLLEYDAAYASGESAGGGDSSDPAAAAGGDTAALAIPDDARVVSISSFSKVLAPGLRLGWIEAAPQIISAVARRGYVVSGGGCAPFTEQIVARVLESGDADAHLDAMRQRCRSRCDALLGALDSAADVLRPLCRPTGGFFVWVEILVEGVTAARLRDECADDVAFLVGDACDCDGLPIGDVAPACLDRHLRLCFAMLDENELVEGVSRIARRAREIRG